MSWFAAHVIMYITWNDGEQPHVPVWENLVLIEAPTSEDAERKAEAVGRLSEGDSDGTLIWDGRPARWNFAGVRKVIACDSSDVPPTDGTEVSYSEFSLASIGDLERLVGGAETELRYIE